MALGLALRVVDRPSVKSVRLPSSRFLVLLFFTQAYRFPFALVMLVLVALVMRGRVESIRGLLIPLGGGERALRRVVADSRRDVHSEDPMGLATRLAPHGGRRASTRPTSMVGDEDLEMFRRTSLLFALTAVALLAIAIVRLRSWPKGAWVVPAHLDRRRRHLHFSRALPDASHGDRDLMVRLPARDHRGAVPPARAAAQFAAQDLGPSRVRDLDGGRDRPSDQLRHGCPPGVLDDDGALSRNRPRATPRPRSFSTSCTTTTARGLKNSPYIHLPAYVQAERGGWLSFHFAQHEGFPFRYRDAADPTAVVPPRTPVRWEWSPQQFQLDQHGARFSTGSWFAASARPTASLPRIRRFSAWRTSKTGGFTIARAARLDRLAKRPKLARLMDLTSDEERWAVWMVQAHRFAKRENFTDAVARTRLVRDAVREALVGATDAKQREQLERRLARADEQLDEHGIPA